MLKQIHLGSALGKFLKSCFKKPVRWVSLGVSFCAIVLSGCQTPPAQEAVKVYPSHLRLEAAKVALSYNIRLQSLVDTCESVDAKVSEFAFATQRQWWDRNWPLVAVANSELGRQVAQKQAKLGKITGQLEALKFELDAKSLSGKTLASNIMTSTQPQMLCRYYLKQFEAGDFDLINTPEHQEVLVAMQKDYPAKANSMPQRVPTLDPGLTPQRKFGRSEYMAFRLAQQIQCANADVINIMDDWPKELYAAFCPNKPPIAIQCNWGECNQLLEGPDDELSASGASSGLQPSAPNEPSVSPSSDSP